MIILNVAAVLVDGSTPAVGLPAVPAAQPLELVAGEDATIAIAVVGSNREPVDLTGGQLILTVRRRPSDAVPTIVRTAIAVSLVGGTAKFIIAAADTFGLSWGPYHYDVFYIAADDTRAQVVPMGRLELREATGQLGEPDTIPIELEALLGGRLLSGEGVPDNEIGFNRDWYLDITDPEAPVLFGPKTLGAWGDGVPWGGGGGGADISTDNPLPAALTADPGASGEVSDAAHVHPYSIAVAGVSDGYMSAAMATQLASLVSADFGGQISSLASTVAGHTSTLASHTSTLASHTSSIAGLATDVSNLASDLTALAGVVIGHTSTLASHTSTLASHTSSIATQGGLISALQAIVFTAGAGLLGGGTLSPGPVAFAVGAHADNSIVVGVDDIRVAPALQTAISDNTANIASLTSTVAGLSGVYVPQSRTITPGAGLVGATALDLSADRSLAVGQNADNSITVNANDIQLSAALQTAISTNTADIASLTSTVSGLSAVYVPLGRTITPGAGLVGATALDLSANRTLDVGANGDGSIVVNANDIQVGVLATDAQHGNRGGGGLHADVVAAGASGFMTGAQATALATATSNIASLTTTVGGHTTTLAGLAALTTKGDLLGYSTGPVRVGVGTDGWVLTADAASAAGWKWAAAAGSSGADALGSYIVQTAANKPVNAQVLGSLTTGFAKVTGTTGVVSTQATIAGTDLSGFTDTTLPVANSSGQLVSSTLTLTSNYLDHAVSSANATVKRSVRNTSNTASAKAWDLIEVAGATADDPYSQYSISGVTNFVVGIDNSDSDYFKIHSGTALDTTTAGFRMATSGNVAFGITAPSAATGALINMRENNGNPTTVTAGNIGSGGSTYTAYSVNSTVSVSAFSASNSFLGTGATQTTQLNHSLGTGGLRVGTSVAADLALGANNVERLRILSAGTVKASLGQTVASASGAIWDGVDVAAATLTLSGSTSITTATGVNLVDVKQPTITSASAVTISHAATMRIAGAPVAAGSTTITKGYSLWIDAGLPRIDSSEANGTTATVLGSLGPAGANTTVQEWLLLNINGNDRRIPCF